jgi:hypothetical protein
VSAQREEQRLRVFEKRVRRKISGPKREREEVRENSEKITQTGVS